MRLSKKNQKNAGKTAKIDVLNDLRAVLQDFKPGTRSKLILGYIDKKIEMISMEEG